MTETQARYQVSRARGEHIKKPDDGWKSLAASVLVSALKDYHKEGKQRCEHCGGMKMVCAGRFLRSEQAEIYARVAGVDIEIIRERM